MTGRAHARSTRRAALRIALWLAPLVAAALMLPTILERLGLRDVSWAPDPSGEPRPIDARERRGLSSP
ncbi:MAG TPA: hypothetical protein VFP65_14035 [Anaeromyxobacteraceae bacterium]|nr:hypothetical protein [Anaeromyxobacteraceae bacterium]